MYLSNIRSPYSDPNNYITTIVTQERTHQQDLFFKSYDEAPPNDYVYRITVTSGPNVHVFNMQVCATTLHAANQYVRDTLPTLLSADAQVGIMITSITEYKNATL
jgi:hypothetical protein